MPFSKQAFQSQVETRSGMIGRTGEHYFFTEHVLRPVEPFYNLISVWGEAGVGKSTLLNRFRDAAHSVEFKEVCLTALVDEWPLTPVPLMECIAAQLRLADAPLVAFERTLARHKEAMVSQREEQEAARTAFLRQIPRLPEDGIRGEPVIGSLYATVAEEVRASYWGERPPPRSARTDILDELTQAFVEDLNWLTTIQVFYPSYRSRRGQRVILFLDGLEPSAVEAVRWLRNQLLAASMSRDVVFVVAGCDSITSALPAGQTVYSMQLARLTENETRLYLAARGIIEASRCDALWQVSEGLPLSLGLLTLDHGAVIDPRKDTPTNVLRWLARQEQNKQQLVLHAALFSGPFHLHELAAFRFLPAAEDEWTRLFRWLITLPFVQHCTLDGRHRYHRLAREWFSHALLQRSIQDYQTGRRALAHSYRRQLERLQGAGGQHNSTSPGWNRSDRTSIEHMQSLCWHMRKRDKNSVYDARTQVMLADRVRHQEPFLPTAAWLVPQPDEQEGNRAETKEMLWIQRTTIRS